MKIEDRIRSAELVRPGPSDDLLAAMLLARDSRDRWRAGAVAAFVGFFVASALLLRDALTTPDPTGDFWIERTLTLVDDETVTRVHTKAPAAGN